MPSKSIVALCLAMGPTVCMGSFRDTIIPVMGRDFSVWPQPEMFSYEDPGTGEAGLCARLAPSSDFTFTVTLVAEDITFSCGQAVERENEEPEPSAIASQHLEFICDAAERYRHIVFETAPNAHSNSGDMPVLNQLQLVLEDPSLETDDLVLAAVMEEGYSLDITQSSSVITAPSVWGLLHGLETFSQVVDDAVQLKYLPISVEDKPEFPWRGLLVDTSRHFLSIDILKRAIDGLSYSKMNVLHWHLIDSQSFPYPSEAYPELQRKGAYEYPRAVYTKENFAEIIEYGRRRGVRILLEMDMPGHAAAWAEGYPELVVACPEYIERGVPFTSALDVIPLDVSKEFTFEVVRSLVEESSALFPDEYYHIGADEVIFECWEESADFTDWAYNEMGFSVLAQAEAYFVNRVFGMLETAGKRPIVWQEAYDNLEEGDVLPENVLVHVWIPANRTTLSEVLVDGHQALLSAGWYLDVQVVDEKRTRFQDSWVDFYENDPYQGLDTVPAELMNNFLGGEAAMWGEQTDDANFESVVWPRTAATAERLWTSPANIGDTQDPGPGGQLKLHSEVIPRLAAFRCQLWRRGIRSGPVAWPSYCPTVTYPAELERETPNSSNNDDNNNVVIIASVVGGVGGLALVAGAFALGSRRQSSPQSKSEPLLGDDRSESSVAVPNPAV